MGGSGSVLHEGSSSSIPAQCSGFVELPRAQRENVCLRHGGDSRGVVLFTGRKQPDRLLTGAKALQSELSGFEDGGHKGGMGRFQGPPNRGFGKCRIPLPSCRKTPERAARKSRLLSHREIRSVREFWRDPPALERKGSPPSLPDLRCGHGARLFVAGRMERAGQVVRTSPARMRFPWGTGGHLPAATGSICRCPHTTRHL